MSLPSREVKIVCLITLSFAVIYLLSIFNMLKLKGYVLDPRAIKLHFTIIFLFLSTYAVYRFFLREMGTSRLLRLIYFAGLINPIFVMFLYLSESFATLFYQFIAVNPITFTSSLLRFPGLSYDGASNLSVFHAFLFMVGTLLYFEEKKGSYAWGLFILLCQLIIIISIIFIGRSGFVVIGVGAVLFGLYILVTKMFLKPAVIKKTVFVFLMLLFLTPLALSIIDLLGMKGMISWAFSFFIGIFTGDSTASDSSVTELLTNHYFLPSDWLDLLTGVSDFGTTSDFFHSDVGYVKFIYGSGVIGLSAFLLVILYFLMISLRHFWVDTRTSFLIFFICISLLVVNMKDFYFWYPYGHYILLFLLVFSLLDKVKRKKYTVPSNKAVESNGGR